MLAFCAPGPPVFRQLNTNLTRWKQTNGRTLPRTFKKPKFSSRTTLIGTQLNTRSSNFVMSLKGLSYAAAAIILSAMPSANLLVTPHLPRPAQATENNHINSAPLRFQQSFTLEEASPIKLDPHWDVHSIESKTETFVMFANDSSQVVDIWWIDYYGREVYYASIRPGSSHMQPSYATHPWVVRDHISQNPLLIMVAKDNPALAIVNNTI